MARELSQRVHATRDYPVAETIIIFGMKWFDNTQNHLHAEGKELFHLSLPSAPSRWGHGDSKDRSIPWRQGREPTNKCIQTSYLQQHNIYSPVHLGNVAQAVSPLVAFVHFVQKAGSGGAEPTMNPGLADHGPGPLTSVLRGVPVSQHTSLPELLNRKTKIPALRPADKVFSEQICLYRQCRNL